VPLVDRVRELDVERIADEMIGEGRKDKLF